MHIKVFFCKGCLEDDLIGSYWLRKYQIIAYVPQNKFIDFVDSLREDYPEYRLLCVDNRGIRERVEKQVKADRIILENSRQKAR